MNKAFVILILLTALVADDRDKGRKGNKAYHEKKYEEAARLYREGIAEIRESTKAEIRTGLHNNLGAALNRLESYDEAQASFAAAIEAAGSEPNLARASYNAGNTAFQAQDPQRALDYYRSALLAEPDNEAARFNYEFVRRLLESQKQEGDSESNQEQPNPDQEQQDQQQERDQEQNEEQEQEQEQDQEQEQQGQDEQQQQQEEQQQEEEQPQPDPSEEMTQEQAEQILQALQNDEEELMREVWRMKGKPRSVDKDW